MSEEQSDTPERWHHMLGLLAHVYRGQRRAQLGWRYPAWWLWHDQLAPRLRKQWRTVFARCIVPVRYQCWRRPHRWWMAHQAHRSIRRSTCAGSCGRSFREVSCVLVLDSEGLQREYFCQNCARQLDVTTLYPLL